MTQGSNRVLDELAKLMTDAAGAAQGVGREVGGVFRAQGEKLLNSMDLVQRDEFDAVMEMARKAREENEALGVRIAVLEALAGVKTTVEAPKTEKVTKPRAKKPAAAK